MSMFRRTPSGTTDPQSAMLSKLKHAFQTYDSASKKYLSAVKELDSALEGIAIAFRELSQGDIAEEARAQADGLCSAIDAHKSANTGAPAAAGGKGGDSAPASAVAAARAAGEERYYFTTYMSDFSQQVTQVFAEFKQSVKDAEKNKSRRDDAVKKYHKQRAEVDELETKLAKKNQGISDNPKYTEKAGKRDAAKQVADAEDAAFEKEYAELMRKRAKTLQLVVTAMGNLSSKYYKNLASVMSAGVNPAGAPKAQPPAEEAAAL